MDQTSVTTGLKLVKWMFNPHHLGNCDQEVKKEFIIFAAVVYDRIWNMRNKKFHEDLRVNSNFILKMVIAAIKEFQEASVLPTNNLTHIEERSTPLTFMPTPFSGGIRILIDAAFKNGETTAGIVAKDNFDRILLIATSIFAAHSSLETELQALDVGLLQCTTRNWHNVFFSLDLKEMVSSIAHHRSFSWCLSHIAFKVISFLISWCLSHIAFKVISFLISCSGKMVWIPKMMNS
ncbi:hypothetical protein PanWU01x14_055700 [Parasponia andersonii]|uniref:RNase H type-1 domain-containing protein n=1 Tax=Parasponia andersonii TaxID=3476 RepID=A0A2P5DK55_PARAD|nr:hypothetical protein PanWU01x14_055700 [Parasponia andersonii]